MLYLATQSLFRIKDLEAQTNKQEINKQTQQNETKQSKTKRHKTKYITNQT